MTALAIKSQIRIEILNILRGINYYTQPGDQPVTIVPSAIVYQKTRAQINRPDQRDNQRTDLPGLLLSDPLQTIIPPTEWTNERDQWHYHWMIQLIDSDAWSETDRLNSWEKWIEQIMSAFEFSCLQNSAVVLPFGQIVSTTCQERTDIDEKFWARSGKFIAGIEIEVRCAQPRGVIA